MNITAPKIVALQALPKLVLLVQARKQARWHWKYGANEHQHAWVLVLDHLDKSIHAFETYVAKNMDIPGFRVKREIVE